MSDKRTPPSQSGNNAPVRQLKIHPTLKIMGYGSTIFMIIVGALTLVGRMFNGSVSIEVTYVVMTLYLVAGFLNILSWALANSMQPR